MAKRPVKMSELTQIESDMIVNLVMAAVEINVSPMTAVREYCDNHQHCWGLREKAIIKDVVESLK